MLVRLQSAIGRDDLVEQMVLIPEPKRSSLTNSQTSNAINLIVGYNASPNSHTALDIAFWIAHQTRLATNQQVVVQAVYVVEQNQSEKSLDKVNWADYLTSCECGVSNMYQSATSVLTQPKIKGISQSLQAQTVTHLEQADKILWQARSLAEEWQGSFKSHLRFGNVATELAKVVKLEAADVLLLGCKSINHKMIQALGFNFPCAILGIPNGIDE
ncbi:universal stress family protein [Nostoc piscinale CENA21]|uniref:Universal stress family protein n=1 Tax=Nostoc piscinale CENA21 TaxID=224013 RepID=A0A0M3V5T5_9NOSO|nr:universal stress protein [Nostoc piscinale]ALF54473.1 universal stress family protein [Nostoc piscinale CENA21]